MRFFEYFFLTLVVLFAVSAADTITLEDGSEVYIGTSGEYTTHSYPDKTIYYNQNDEADRDRNQSRLAEAQRGTGRVQSIAGVHIRGEQDDAQGSDNPRKN